MEKTLIQRIVEFQTQNGEERKRKNEDEVNSDYTDEFEFKRPKWDFAADLAAFFNERNKNNFENNSTYNSYEFELHNKESSWCQYDILNEVKKFTYEKALSYIIKKIESSKMYPLSYNTGISKVENSLNETLKKEISNFTDTHIMYNENLFNSDIYKTNFIDLSEEEIVDDDEDSTDINVFGRYMMFEDTRYNYFNGFEIGDFDVRSECERISEMFIRSLGTKQELSELLRKHFLRINSFNTPEEMNEVDVVIIHVTEKELPNSSTNTDNESISDMKITPLELENIVQIDEDNENICDSNERDCYGNISAVNSSIEQPLITESSEDTKVNPVLKYLKAFKFGYSFTEQNIVGKFAELPTCLSLLNVDSKSKNKLMNLLEIEKAKGNIVDGKKVIFFNFTMRNPCLKMLSLFFEKIHFDENISINELFEMTIGGHGNKDFSDKNIIDYGLRVIAIRHHVHLFKDYFKSTDNTLFSIILKFYKVSNAIELILILHRKIISPFYQSLLKDSEIDWSMLKDTCLSSDKRMILLNAIEGVTSKMKTSTAGSKQTPIVLQNDEDSYNFETIFKQTLGTTNKEMEDMEMEVVEMEDVEMEDVEMPNIDITNGEMPNMEITYGEMSNMEITYGEMPNMEIKNWKIPNMEITYGEMPYMGIKNGKIPNIEIANGKMIDHLDKVDESVTEFGNFTNDSNGSQNYTTFDINNDYNMQYTMQCTMTSAFQENMFVDSMLYENGRDYINVDLPQDNLKICGFPNIADDLMYYNANELAFNGMTTSYNFDDFSINDPVNDIIDINLSHMDEDIFGCGVNLIDDNMPTGFDNAGILSL